MDDIKKELKSAGVLAEAIEQLMQVLSIKSLTELEGQLINLEVFINLQLANVELNQGHCH